jgi:hypothetical protein
MLIELAKVKLNISFSCVPPSPVSGFRPLLPTPISFLNRLAEGRLSGIFVEMKFIQNIRTQKYLKLRVERFEIFTAVTMKNGVFWDVTPCGSCKKRRFGGT